MTGASLVLEIRCKSTAKKETAQKIDDFGNVLEVFRKFFGKLRNLFGRLSVVSESSVGVG